MKPDNTRPIDIDAAIDRAVRSMMSAEPRAGMRQRVLSRINEAPRRAVPIWRLAIAGGGIAVIALAVAVRVLDRPTHPEEPTPVLVTAPPPVTQAPSPGQPQVTRVPPPISAAPPMRRTPPPSQPIPRGLVVAQSLASLEAEDPVQSGSAPQAEAMPQLQQLQIPALSAISDLDTPVGPVPAITLPPIEIQNLQPIAPLQGPSLGPSR